jgi:hypothetical protein
VQQVAEERDLLEQVCAMRDDNGDARAGELDRAAAQRERTAPA